MKRSGTIKPPDELPLPWALGGAGLPLLLLLCIPVFALASRLTWPAFAHCLGERTTQQAVWLSFYTSALTTFLVLLSGTPLAVLLARRRPGRFTRVLEVLIDLPTVFPPAVAGVALLLVFSRTGFLGRQLASVGIELPFTTAAVVLAQMFVAAPFYIKTAAVGFSGISRELTEAAALDGASAMQSLRYVVLPHARRAMLSGATLCWARAMGEFGATMLFAGNYPGRTQTISLAIYIGFEIDLDQALTLSAILLLASLLVLLMTKFLMRRQAGE